MGWERQETFQPVEALLLTLPVTLRSPSRNHYHPNFLTTPSNPSNPTDVFGFLCFLCSCLSPFNVKYPKSRIYTLCPPPNPPLTPVAFKSPPFHQNRLAASDMLGTFPVPVSLPLLLFFSYVPPKMFLPRGAPAGGPLLLPH